MIAKNVPKHSIGNNWLIFQDILNILSMIGRDQKGVMFCEKIYVFG
jgi:hypothetical protein